jgi:hypothetical protein
MSELPTTSGASERRVRISFVVWIAIAMTVLAVVGTGVTIADAASARRYWLFLVPVFGIMCIATAWYHDGFSSEKAIRQLLHWAAVGLTIVLDFAFLQGSGEQTAAATGLSSLLILALGCLLAGIHLEWTYAIVGLLLFSIFTIVALAQEYLILVTGIGALLVLIVLAWHVYVRREAA